MNTDISTKPEDYRQLDIQPGTRIGLIGDYNGPSTWSHEKLIITSSWRYIVLQKNALFGRPAGEWDTAILVTLKEDFETVDMFPNKVVKVNAFILVHRYGTINGHTPPWQQEATLLVYGIRSGEELVGDFFRLEEWLPKTAYLSAAAVLTVEDPISNPNYLAYGREILEL